jgi:hypothetical protein
MADKKAETLTALRTVRPLPADLIVLLEKEQDQTEIDAWITTWMRRTKEDWLHRRPDDGADIFNALHANQGKHHDSV